MATYRLVIHDSPEHESDYIRGLFERTLGLTSQRALDLADEMCFATPARIPLADRAAVEAAFEKVLAAGPDPEVPGSKGSLVAAIEEVGEDGAARVLRCGRSIEGRFVAMTLEDIEALLGLPFAAMPIGAPLLAVHGDDPDRSARSVVLALLLGLVVAAANVGLAVAGFFPWFLDARGEVYFFAPLLVGVVPVALAFAWVKLAARRSGAIAFYDNVLVVNENRHRWEDVRAFDDDQSDHVRLLRSRGGVALPTLTIPTLSEKDRAAVLALLLQRGVPRHEGRE